MKLDVNHRTTYRYSQAVALSRHRLHLLPRPTLTQNVVHSALLVEPAASFRRDAIDAFGNSVTTIEIERPHTELVILANMSVDVSLAVNGETSNASRLADLSRELDELDRGTGMSVWPYRSMTAITRPNGELRDYCSASFQAGASLAEACRDLAVRFKADFRFDPSATDVSTPIAKAFAARRGVCQDFAHLMIGGLRALGIPVRYVSGYILTFPPPGRPRLQGADASHAWVSVWCGAAAGWVDFDPTNGRTVGDDYATLGWGRDYSDIAPISGVLIGGGAHQMSVSVNVKAADG